MIKKIKNKIAQMDSAQYLFSLAGVVLVIGVLLLAWFATPVIRGFFAGLMKASGTAPEEAVATAEPLHCKFRRTLDGVCVEREEDIAPRIVGIMVENNFEAWPLSGISRASVVYEAPVEGHIPRFFALYPEDADAEQVGPVRSARPYFVDWAGEYPGAMFLHVGGSPEALDRLQQSAEVRSPKSKLIDINGITRGWYFWRDEEERRAPHNTYTSSRLWAKAAEAYGSGFPVASSAAWAFQDAPEPCADSCVTGFTVSFSPGGYSAAWRYNEATGKYERYQQNNTAVDRDTDGSPIAADTVIIQEVNATILDAVGRLRVDTIGEGEAVVIRDGVWTAGRWKKPSRDARTVWVDEAGSPISLKPGTIWIEVIDQNGSSKKE